MEISKYIGIDCDKEYTANELDNIFSKFNNLDIGDYRIDFDIVNLLSNQNSLTIIKFISMFRDINKFESDRGVCKYTLAGSILYVIRTMEQDNKICVYNIMDHLLQINMDTETMHTIDQNGTIQGIKYCGHCEYYSSYENHNTVEYIVDNYDTIQNVKKIINNYDIILFDITNDLQIIESLLMISKYKHKIVPKFIITHKILYWYLFDKNKMYNI